MRIEAPNVELAARRIGRNRSLRWAAFAVVIVIAGALVSLLASDKVASQARQQSQQAFINTSAQTASAFQTSLQHETISSPVSRRSFSITLTPPKQNFSSG